MGVKVAITGWKHRKLHQLITGTPTTDIQDVNSEGTIELKGAISGPVAGSGFVSPVTQTDETVFAGWRVEEWTPHVEGGHHWKTIASGTDSVPFHLDDGTDRIQVAIGDSDDVTWKGGSGSRQTFAYSAVLLVLSAVLLIAGVTMVI